MDTNALPIVYMAHPYGGDPKNIDRAKRWLRFLWSACTRHDFIAPWIPNVEVLSEEEFRTRGLLFDCETVRRCNGLALVGGFTSPGMETEARVAGVCELPIYDLLHMGAEPPQIFNYEDLTKLSPLFNEAPRNE